MRSFTLRGYFFDVMALFGGKDTILTSHPLKRSGLDLELVNNFKVQ